MKKVNFIAVIALFFSLLISSCSTSSIEEERNLYTAQIVSDLEMEILSLVNEYRSSQGLNVLEFSSVAYYYATTHSKSMANEGEISHKNFDVRSSKLAVEADANYVSENIGRNFKTAKGLVRAWINSPTHKEIMEGDYKYTAVSAVPDEYGELYYTQLFLR
ncbi:CAP domain-containing protein [Muricauda sp. ANG21]|uniref:CAP domain-containing protein n=1 Tax=Allomuricauda sp. ANG21 TaxID=3042468 RepID=UPI003451DE79